MMKNKAQLTIPINIVTIFQIFTVLLFFVGPIEHKLNNPYLDFFYLLAVILSLRLGYYSYIRSSKFLLHVQKNEEDDNIDEGLTKKQLRRFDLVCILYFSAAVLMLISRTGSFSISLSTFANLGDAYYNRGSTNLLYERIIVLLSPIMTMFIPYGMRQWKWLKVKRRIVFLFLILFRVLVDAVQGINKSFADLVIFLLIYGIFIYARNTVKQGQGLRKFIKRLTKVAFLVGICGALFLMFFSINIMSRTSLELDQRQSGIHYIISYLTEGYQAVDYSLTQPFTSTYGLGNSLYLLSAIDSEYLFMRTYLMKNELLYGWDYYTNWSSLYVWIGNDVSMLGVIPVMFLIGRLFAKTWSEALYLKNNLASLIVSGLLFQLCLYSSANNQIVQIQIAFVGTWFWLLYWLLHKRVKITFRKRNIL